MRTTRLAALATALLLCGSARADRPLTLDEALSVARRTNRDLQAARARLLQAKVGIEQAWVALLPVATLQGKYTHNYKGAALNLGTFNQGVLGLAGALEQANAAAPPSAQNPALAPALSQLTQQLDAARSGVITIQKQEQLDSSINLTVPLVVPSAYASLSSAKSSYASSEANFEVTETGLLFSVAQAFYAAAGADELLLARQDAVDVAQKTLFNSQVKLSAGTAKRTDVNQAELTLLQAQQLLLQAQDSRSQGYRALATLVQLEEPFQVKPPPDIESVPYSLDTLVQRALASRPEFRAYDKSVAAYRAQISAADWRWSPTLAAFGRGQLSNYAGFTGDPYSWAVGVELDWSLFDGGNRDAQRHLGEAQLAEADAHLAAQRDSVRNEVQSALENLVTGRAGLTTAQRSVALAKEILRMVRAQYDAGTATQLDVLQAQESLVNAEVSLAQARFNLALNKLTLERTAGLFPEGKP